LRGPVAQRLPPKARDDRSEWPKKGHLNSSFVPLILQAARKNCVERMRSLWHDRSEFAEIGEHDLRIFSARWGNCGNFPQVTDGQRAGSGTLFG
jgi:hypothetical protein